MNVNSRLRQLEKKAGIAMARRGGMSAYERVVFGQISAEEMARLRELAEAHDAELMEMQREFVARKTYR